MLVGMGKMTSRAKTGVDSHGYNYGYKLFYFYFSSDISYTKRLKFLKILLSSNTSPRTN